MDTDIIKSIGIIMKNEITSDEIITLIVKGKRSYKRPQVGDIFSFEMKGIGFIHGLVAKNDFVWKEDSPSEFNIVYIYKDITEKFNTDINLKKDNFLIAPVIVNDMQWRTGYFKTYKNLTKSEYSDLIFEDHCIFDDLRDNKYRYTNQENQPCEKFNPIVSRWLGSAFTIAIKSYLILYPEIKFID